MGQGAVEDVKPVDSQVLIANVKKLMSYIGLLSDDWQPKLSMAPRVVLTPLSEACIPALERLKRIKINGSSINIQRTASSDIRLDISLANQTSSEILDGNKIVAPNEIGIENVNLQDASGSYAYHIPEGILMHYNPVKLNQNSKKETWISVSDLDLAPPLLKKFGVKAPSYMKKNNILSASNNA